MLKKSAPPLNDPQIATVADLLKNAMELLIKGNFFDEDHIQLLVITDEKKYNGKFIGTFITPPHKTVPFYTMNDVYDFYRNRELLKNSHNTAYQIICNFAQTALSYFICGSLMHEKIDRTEDPEYIEDLMWAINYYSLIEKYIPLDLTQMVETKEHLDNLENTEKKNFNYWIKKSVATFQSKQELQQKLDSFDIGSTLMFSALCIKLGLIAKPDFTNKALELLSLSPLDSTQFDFSIFKD